MITVESISSNYGLAPNIAKDNAGNVIMTFKGCKGYMQIVQILNPKIILP